MRHIPLCFALAAACALHADTIVMKTGQKIDGKVLSTNGATVEVEVSYGTMRIATDLILTVEQDTPEKIAARTEEKAQEKEHAAMMKAEGKVLYKGKWVDEAEKDQLEAKAAEEKKKKDDEKAAAKKKKEDELAKKREEEKKRLDDEQKRRDQIAATQKGRNDPRADRFNRGRVGDDNGDTTNTTNNNVNNTGTNNYGGTGNNGRSSYRSR